MVARILCNAVTDAVGPDMSAVINLTCHTTEWSIAVMGIKSGAGPPRVHNKEEEKRKNITRKTDSVDVSGGEEKRLDSLSYCSSTAFCKVGGAGGEDAQRRTAEKGFDKVGGVGGEEAKRGAAEKRFGKVGGVGGEEARRGEAGKGFGKAGGVGGEETRRGGEAQRLDSFSPTSLFGFGRSGKSSRSVAITSSSVNSSISSGTPIPLAAAHSTASRLSCSPVSVVEEEAVVIEKEDERPRGRTTSELNRSLELVEEERSKSAERIRIGGRRTGGGEEALDEEEEEIELSDISCCFPSHFASPSPKVSTTTLRPKEERSLEGSAPAGRNSSSEILTQRKGEADLLFEGLSATTPRFCDILTAIHTSSLPRQANCLIFERKEDDQLLEKTSPFEGLPGLLGDLVQIGEPPPYFSPPSEEEEASVPNGDLTSSTKSTAKPKHQDQQVSSRSRKEGLAGLVELARLSEVPTSLGLSGTSKVCNSFQEKRPSDEIQEVEKNCIVVHDKETKSLKPWEYELFHGFSQERVCYVEGETPHTSQDFINHHPRSSTWEEDLLAGFSNLSLQNKRNNLFTGERFSQLFSRNNIDNSHDYKLSGEEGCLNPAPLIGNDNDRSFATEAFSNLCLQNSNHHNIKSLNNNLRGERLPNLSAERNINYVKCVTGDVVHAEVEVSVEKKINDTGPGEVDIKVEDKHISILGQQGNLHYEEEFSLALASTESLSLRDSVKSCPRDRPEPAVEQQEKSFQSLLLSSFHSITDDCLESRELLQSFVSRIPPPPPSCYTRNRIKMAPIDPHSFTDSSHPLTKHIALSLFLDFQAKIISGTATLTLERSHKGEIFLDTRDLTIESAEDSQNKKSLKFLLEKQDAIKGSLLRIVLEEEASVFSVTFKTSQSASALQWLDPSQTAGEKLPYVFTQCQAIHARSIFPCQDTPIARIRYSADVNVPAELSVVMSASHVGRAPSSDSAARAIESFVMDQPIPPYLFALAAGDITYEEVGPRTRIYAEPSEVKAAAYEFANTEETVKKAEALFGPYDWERFDLLVMPPSFPYGGMENPRMVFLTPTIIVGDRSGVEVVAHELAHSWTGNLISNATANDFWLNEGFTTYAERRIIEVQDGLESVQLHIGIGWQGLEEEVERFKDRPEMTKLKMQMEGVDPDEIYSKIPYEKGFQFLRRLEFQVGRPTFDDFLKKYIAKFRFQSIDTETFLVFLKENLPRIEEQVDLQTWIHGTGIPDDAIRPKAGLLQRVQSLADGYQSGGKPTSVETATWSAQAWIVYLERLPKKLSAEQIRELEELYHFSASPNWEIKIGILTIAANSAYQPFYPQIETSLHIVGRMKYLKPLYQGLLEGSSEGKSLALKVFAEAKSKYHPIAQVVIQGLLTKYTSS